jgi:TPR repeat protein
MPTFRGRAAAAVFLGLGALFAGARVHAFEDSGGAKIESAKAEQAPLPAFASAGAALRAGLEDFRAGDPAAAIEALKYAAARGELLALWKLAKIYASGDGVPRDDLRAYEYFSQIAGNYDEDDPNRRDRAIVSSAFVALGIYTLDGIPGSKIAADPQRALRLFQFAATNFGDPDAQYRLARMHLGAAGLMKDIREGLRWLFLAADKGHVEAQALLGQMLFSGRDGIHPQRARGLMWLTLAREAAIDSKKDKWIIELYDKAVASANDQDRNEALAYLEDHLRRRN